MEQYTFQIPNTPVAKQLLNFILLSEYFNVIDKKKIPNNETLETIEAVERGEVKEYENAKSMFNELKENANV